MTNKRKKQIIAAKYNNKLKAKFLFKKLSKNYKSCLPNNLMCSKDFFTFDGFDKSNNWICIDLYTYDFNIQIRVSQVTDNFLETKLMVADYFKDVRFKFKHF